MSNTTATPPNVRVGVATLVIDTTTGLVLLGRRKGSHGAGTWQSPGGHLEFGEDWATCAQRELEEETGLKVPLSNFKYFACTNDIMPKDNKHYITIFMRCDWDGEQVPQTLEPHKCEGWYWRTWQELCLSNPLFTPMENLIQEWALEPPSTPAKPRDLSSKVLLFMGYPGSGKGTQGKRLATVLGIEHVSTGELYRAEAKTGSELGAQMDVYMQRGEIIPSDLTFTYLENELSKPKYRKGFILDGYPKDEECLKWVVPMLARIGYSILGAFNFHVDRSVVVERLTGRLMCKKCEHNFHKKLLPPKADGICDNCGNALSERKDDVPEAINNRLNVYERSTECVRQHFEASGRLHLVDAAKPPSHVSAQIVAIIDALCANRGSYYLYPIRAGVEERSTVFHNHVDAESHVLLREVLAKVQHAVPQVQQKIYPISDLLLGPQSTSEHSIYKTVYNRLPNFHRIHDAQNEAFSTGKMGDTFDVDMVKRTLEACASYPGRGMMTEVEEDVYDETKTTKGGVTTSEVHFNRGTGDGPLHLDQLGYDKERLATVPKWELHHGVDIPKTAGETGPPIDLDAIMKATVSAGFQPGGWFIFSKPDRWAYRTNEFSDAEYEDAIGTLKSQASALVGIIQDLAGKDTDFVSTCSMEVVHMIWQF